ncbi:hypothetical protein OPT61_g4923 [Boeremia exigua]|uniref:Uncharacterized protein n=1 Tax=Boeremia exigua TaxID=749465 RepID=A0ACC2ICB6_9PLEO|nr:hypothetical protein OPT61_g4923 [Boeremia exigua]
MKLLYLSFLFALSWTAASSAIPAHHVTQSYSHLQSRAVDIDTEWEKAWCKGGKFSQAMIRNEDQAAAYVTPVRSPWDGNLVQQFRTWGYREIENHRSDLCDFGPDQHNLQRAFTDLGIDTASSADGGPNQCFYVEHKYGPTVQRPPNGQWPDPSQQYYMVGEKRLRETQAYSTIGINPTAGALFFLNRLSPAKAAQETWNLPEVRKEWLPALASSSDHAWGFWNRASAGNLGNVKKIFACMITNEITLALIEHALKTYPLGPGEVRPRGVEKWPGTTFPMRYDAAQALLGSPNGLGVGYFLAQHKHRLGNKAVDKVTVFRPDRGMMPYLLFWIEDAPAASQLSMTRMYLFCSIQPALYTVHNEERRPDDRILSKSPQNHQDLQNNTTTSHEPPPPAVHLTLHPHSPPPHHNNLQHPLNFQHPLSLQHHNSPLTSLTLPPPPLPPLPLLSRHMPGHPPILVNPAPHLSRNPIPNPHPVPLHRRLPLHPTPLGLHRSPRTRPPLRLRPNPPPGRRLPRTGNRPAQRRARRAQSLLPRAARVPRSSAAGGAAGVLGSPNGLAAGYFLAQHKEQLGGNKVIDKITVFRSEHWVINVFDWEVRWTKPQDPEAKFQSKPNSIAPTPKTPENALAAFATAAPDD